MRGRHALGRLALFLAFAATAPACSSGASEGRSCDRANGNNDCASGLVCRAAIDIAASSSRCCPRPPGKPSVSACGPAVKDFQPDPSVPPYGNSGGNPGSGGNAGTGGAAGSGGHAGAGGTAGNGGTDAGSGGTDAGSAGTGGNAGSPSDAGGD